MNLIEVKLGGVALLGEVELERLVPIEGPYDLRSSLGSLRKSGLTPPIARWVDQELFKATSTPDGKRASILLHAARVANRLEEAASMPVEAAQRRLLAVRGIGPWTVGLVGGVALGHPDAVAFGDYHLKNMVAWHLAGEARATDERMMELLAPYKGHQRRVIALLGTTGKKAPRFGHRTSVSDIRRR